MSNDTAKKTPIEDLRRDALAHYNELASKFLHWSGFVVDAIKAYNPESHPSTPQPKAPGSPVISVCKKSITFKTDTKELTISEDGQRLDLLMVGFRSKEWIISISPNQFIELLNEALQPKEFMYGSHSIKDEPSPSLVSMAIQSQERDGQNFEFKKSMDKANKPHKDMVELYLASDQYEIFSVKRISDGEVFTVGDEISWGIHESFVTKLLAFKIEDGRLKFDDSKRGEHLGWADFLNVFKLHKKLKTKK